MSTSTVPRRYFLDWLRIIAFGLLVAYHVGMYYVSWDWHVKSSQLVTGLEPWMRLLSPWRMDLLFLISGAATGYLIERRGSGSEVLAARTRFLLLPLAFGMGVVVPPQSYLEVIQRFGYAGSYLDFMQRYLASDPGFCRSAGHCLMLPTWNHLWYLPYLALYTWVLWALLLRAPRLVERAAHALPRALQGARLLWLPMLVLLAGRWLLGGRFPPTHSLINDWALHAQYLPIFLLGALLARTPDLWTRFVQLRWAALGLALLAWGLSVALPGAAAGSLALLRAPLFAVQQWGGLAAVLGLAARHLDRDHPARRYLTQAVFPLYLFHQTVIILLARALAPWQMAWAAEASLLLIGGLALSLLAAEATRRVSWLRPWVGWHQRSALAPAPVTSSARQGDRHEDFA